MQQFDDRALFAWTVWAQDPASSVRQRASLGISIRSIGVFPVTGPGEGDQKIPELNTSLKCS